MIFDDLKKIVRANAGLSGNAYLLNLLKEKLQDYILYFIGAHKEFNGLIFTGGTCLRKIYGLNRLSVDLDLDYADENFSHDAFAEKLTRWFAQTYQVKNISADRRKETVKVKIRGGLEEFPGIGKQVLFVSVDLSRIKFKKYDTEKNLISTPEFSFFITSFDLPTMFANKICAFLGRQFFFGKGQEVSFKARDVYDLFWLCQRSRQNGYRLRPNFERIFEELNTSRKDEVLKRVIDKVGRLDDRQLLTQLLPFFPDQQFVKEFVKNYRSALTEECRCIFL